MKKEFKSGNETMENSVVEPQFSLKVFNNHAIIKGNIDVKILDLLFKLCRWYGFSHLTPMDDGQQGFKLVTRSEN